MSSANTTNEESNVISVGSYIRSNIREYGMLIALVAIMVFFQFYTGGILFRPVNLTNLILQNSFIVIMALGMLLVIVAGHIDLSVGSIVAFVGAIAAILTVQWGMNPFLAALICLVIGGIIGAAQGYWIAYHRIPSFIVTLAGMLVFRGLTLFVLGGKNIGPFPTDFQIISTGFLPDIGGIEGLNTTSMILTLLITVVLFYLAWRRRVVNVKHGIDVEPFGFFIVQNLLISGAILFLGYQSVHLSRPAERPDRDAGSDCALQLRDAPHDHWPPRLRHGRQREGDQAFRYQHRTPELPHLRQHGCTGRSGRHDHRDPPQLGNAEGRRWLRA